MDNSQIDKVTVKNSKNHTYIISKDGKVVSTQTLTVNKDGLVKFPSSGEGFGRYGTEDEGGDHYLKPKTAAALFGLTSKMEDNDSDFRVDFGDMSAENGGAPGGNHKMHGGSSGYSGVCIDYRYLNDDNQSYRGLATDSQFSTWRNVKFLKEAGKWGFNKNYASNKDVWKISILTFKFQFTPNAKKIDGHNDHGHLTYTK